MATSYSKYTGGTNTSAAIYTVPTGKVAKIIITDLSIQSGFAIQIGSYKKQNDTGSPLYTRISSSTASGSGTNTPYVETEGIIVPRRNTSFTSQCMMLKSSHILLEGEIVYFSGASPTNSISFTVIEEDV